MATHSSVLAWRIPGMVEPGRLPSMGSHRVGHNWSNLEAAAAATESTCFLSLFDHCDTITAYFLFFTDHFFLFLFVYFLPSIGFPLDTLNYSLSLKYYFCILWLFYGFVLFLLSQSKNFVHSLSPSSNFILCMKSSWNNDQYSIPPFETLTLLFIPNQ